MTDRLADLVLGLQRMAEGARLRGDDLRYIQQRDTDEHVAWLEQLLDMVEKVRLVLLEERKAFLSAHDHRVHQLQQKEQAAADKVPRVVKQGPAAG